MARLDLNWLLLFALLWKTSVIFAQSSYVQIVAEPGVSVFLDDVFKGVTTSDVGGLIIENVPAGRHTIRVVIQEFNVQEERISIKQGEVYTFKVRPLLPQIRITQQGNIGEHKIERKAGKIKIQSLPVTISISIPSLGVMSSKSQDEWLAEDIPVGNYVAVFAWDKNTLTDTITVRHDALSHLFVNLVKGEIEDRSAFSDADELLRYKSSTPRIDESMFVLVKGGTFVMGDGIGDGNDDERPAHTVTVSDFYIGRFEVTQKLWRSVMGTDPSYFQGCDECPVEQISWDDVQRFLATLNRMTGKRYRLPTEAEWEYTARSGTVSFKYAGGPEPDAVAWFYDNSESRTHPVGQKKPNELGLFDMTGNVWEWCEDWYAEDYYSQSAVNDPKGASTGTSRVLRGGSWGVKAHGARISVRNRVYQEVGNRFNGFRLVRDP